MCDSPHEHADVAGGRISELEKQGRGRSIGRMNEQMAEMLVCREGELADGGVRILRDGKMEIGIIRHGGKYYAYRNYCPHQGGPACEGLRMPQVKELIDEITVRPSMNRTCISSVPGTATNFISPTGSMSPTSGFDCRSSR